MKKSLKSRILCAKSSDLDVIWRPIRSLRPRNRNARVHSDRQLAQLAASLREFGFTNPVLIDGQGVILAGHARVEAAKILGMSEVPTLCLAHMSEAQKKAYTLADNRLAELASWDEELLVLEIKELVELDYNVEITGYSTAEIDVLLEDADSGKEHSVEDEIPEVPTSPISRRSDLWQLGPHLLLCADARDVRSYRRLMGADLAQMVITDPPFNVRVRGHVRGRGSHHGEFVMASGEMSPAEFTAFLKAVLRQLSAFSTDGSIHFIFHDWRHMSEMLAAGKSVYDELKNVCVWVKDNAGLGSFYRSQYELCFVWKRGTAAHINNFGLGETGRHRTNIWAYRRPPKDELGLHPTPKSVAMIADALRDCSKRGGLVLDPFLGSGTTIIAAERTGRVARTMELDPKYVDVAIRRWEALTGGKAREVTSGLALDELGDARGVTETDTSKEAA